MARDDLKDSSIGVSLDSSPLERGPAWYSLFTRAWVDSVKLSVGYLSIKLECKETFFMKRQRL